MLRDDRNCEHALLQDSAPHPGTVRQPSNGGRLSPVHRRAKNLRVTPSRTSPVPKKGLRPLPALFLAFNRSSLRSRGGVVPETTQTTADGSIVTYDPDGRVIRQVTADGTVFDHFDAAGRPGQAALAGSGDRVSITYDGDQSTWHYPDSTVTRNGEGDVVRLEAADGTVFDRFDADGRPLHGTLPDGAGAVDIGYRGDESTWTYRDGGRVTRDADGGVVRQQTADGTVFDRFGGDGRPLHGTVPGENGEPPQDVTIAYDGDASTWAYADGTTVNRNSDGAVTQMRTADGASFDRFDADGRPIHGSLPGDDGEPPQDVTIAYDGDASTWTYADGTTLNRDSDGAVTHMRTSDGASFDRFDADGRPIHCSLPGENGEAPQEVNIAYNGDASTWTYGDGTTLNRDSDGAVTHMRTADGASFDRFDADGRPTHGSLPGDDGEAPQEVNIAYNGDASTWTYTDGTTLNRNADGTVTHMRTTDGASFDRFDADGRPLHGSLPGEDGAAPQDVTIAYDGDASTWTYTDGTTLNRNADGTVTHMRTTDGASFDRFDADGRPLHGSLPGENGEAPQEVNIAYNGDASTWTYADGTTLNRNADGTVTHMRTTDGASFDRFDADGRPLHGSLPGEDGAAPQDVTIAYDGDASTWTYADGTTLNRNADGTVTHMRTADGASFDRFDSGGRPTHGTLPGDDGEAPQEVNIAYDGDASTWTYGDGTTLNRNADGTVTHMRTADGASFDRFDSDGRPTHGTLLGENGEPPQDVTIAYNGDASTWTYGDGTTLNRGADGQVTHMRTSDGASFDRFDADGRPTHGSLPGENGEPPQDVTIAYDGDASTWTYGDGTTLNRDSDGAVTHMRTSDGASFDRFDADGRPLHGTVPGENGEAPQDVAIAYDGDASTWTYGDGTTLNRGADGQVTHMRTSDGATFDRFDADGRPTHGSLPGEDGAAPQDVAIAYDGDASTWTYGDGTTLNRDADGTVTHMRTSDGASFDRFDADGRPTHGSLPGEDGAAPQDVRIAYDGDASTWTYGDGTTLNRDSDGAVTHMRTSDGASFDRFDADGRPLHGTVPGENGEAPQDVAIAYDGDASTWTYGDGTTLNRGADGQVTHMRTSDGATFDRFDADGRPIHGTVPGENGEPPQDVAIAYDGDASTWTYGDGTTLNRDADGQVTHMRTADGASFDRFDSGGRPTHGTLPGDDGEAPQEVNIAYNGDASTWTYADGTTLNRNADGTVTHMRTTDGASFDRFDADGRPLHGSLPGENGEPPQDVTIAYNGDASTWTYADGTTLNRDSDGTVTHMRTADGASFDRFDSDGRPTHGTLPGENGEPPQDVTIAYNGDASTWTYADGTTLNRNADGQVTHMRTADGASFDRFDADGRPLHGSLPGENGEAPQEVNIAYNGDASTWTYADGTTLNRNADGTVTHMRTTDGASFDRFDADGRPLHGSLPGENGEPPQDVTIAYNGDASTWTYGDGTTLNRGADGQVTHMRTSDGASFDRFDADGRPLHGSLPGENGEAPQDVTIAYNGDASTWTYTDGTTLNRDADGTVTHMRTADGASFDRFDADGRPTHGTIPGDDGAAPQEVTIAYDGDASTWTYTDGTTVNRNSDGAVTQMRTADGASFDRFDADGRPLHGTLPGENGEAPQDVTIAYDGDASTWTYADGTTVNRDVQGNPVHIRTADGATFDRFDADGRPLHGTVPGENGEAPRGVTIAYDGDASTWTYTDGTTVNRNSDGAITQMRTADGATFDRFDGDGRPLHGTVPGEDGAAPQDVTIEYSPTGSTWRYSGPDGSTTVYRDAQDQVVRQELPDGTVYDAFTSDGDPTHGQTPGKNGPQDVTIEYSAAGSKWTYVGPDGTTTVFRDTDDRVVRQELPDGTVYDAFNGNGDPTHGSVPATDGRPAQAIDVSYHQDGTSTWTFTDEGTGDKTLIYRDAESNTTRMDAGGWTFTDFSTDGRPLSGHRIDAPGETVKVEYTGTGSRWTYDNGTGDVTVITKNADDRVVSMTSGGWTFTEFDSMDRPLRGSKPGADGGGTETVTIAYTSDGSVWTYVDSKGATSVLTRDATGDVVELRQDGWTYTDFDAEGRPLYGTKDGDRVSIRYDSNGITESTFITPDGHWTTVGTDATGRPIFQIVDGVPAAFAVEIPKLKLAKEMVAQRQERIEGDLSSIKNYYSSITDSWDSPAGDHFAESASKLQAASDKINQVLKDSVTAMQKSYDHYLEAEGGNLKNMIPATASDTYNTAVVAQILAEIIQRQTPPAQAGGVAQTLSP
ncbi:WXG100 family type VII secretion target [Micromonospora sp. NPDC049044]|uniref:WXG100 family type VII secretion target n=1 Tax=Micromonospora sp. NPDC049044 TaxID=3154827 RepID=UPI0033C59463